MRIARFSLNGEPRFGLVDGPELIVLNGHPLVNGVQPTNDRVAIKDVKLLAPSIPSKVVCIGKNYSDHIAELGLAPNPEPTIFLKPSSSIIGPGDAIVLPSQSDQVELEVELAVIMGKLTRNVSIDEAIEHVWGYTVANDVTARDLQFSDAQWARSKAFDTFCPLGPWIETEFIPEGQIIESRINGEVAQASTLDQMIHGVAEIISYVSENMTLLPGDVIITGAPAGVRTLKRGDIVECEIEGVGNLFNPVI
jgi:2-keto-4-pentenoate hydratase/2-oxohepta-3-ene-1,7-dioic acid hydratase in catechol pathway